MKDLIAKLHSNAADQILATFSTLEMQLQGFAKSSYEKDLRIAELEAQIAAASAPVVEQRDLKRELILKAQAILAQHLPPCGTSEKETISALLWLLDGPESRAALAASQLADTDKLREALKLAVRQNSCDMLMTGEEIRKCEAALNSTALQAPVREVPGGWEFNGADFSLKAAGKSNTGHASLIRDLEGRAAWHALDDEGKNSTPLYIYGDGETISDAIADAVKRIPATPVQEPKP